MGANQSSGGGGSSEHGSGAPRDQGVKRDLYEVLSVDLRASEEE